MNAGYACSCIITVLPARSGLCGVLYCTAVCDHWVIMDYFRIPCHLCTLMQVSQVTVWILFSVIKDACLHVNLHLKKLYSYTKSQFSLCLIYLLYFASFTLSCVNLSNVL